MSICWDIKNAYGIPLQCVDPMSCITSSCSCRHIVKVCTSDRHENGFWKSHCGDTENAIRWFVFHCSVRPVFWAIHCWVYDKVNYYIPNCKRQSHRTIPTTWPYNILRYWYGWYWTVVIAQLSAVDLLCKDNHKSRWPRKSSEWGAGSFRLIVCERNTSVNILFIINNIFCVYVLS